MNFKEINGKRYVKVGDKWLEVTPEEFISLMADESEEKLKALAERKNAEEKKKIKIDYNSISKKEYDKRSTLDILVNGIMDELKNLDYRGMIPKIIGIKITRIPNDEEEITEKEPLVEIIEQEKDYIITILPGKPLNVKKENINHIFYSPQDNILGVVYKNKEGVEDSYCVRVKRIKDKVKYKELTINNGVLEIILEKE